MAVKTKTNRKKSKGRARRAAPLLGRNGDVRRSDTMTRSLPERSPAASVVGDMTLPVRLMSQLPLQVWRAQAMLAYQGLMMMQAMAFGRPIGSLPMP